VNDNVEIVGGVDNPGHAAKNKNYQSGKQIGKQPAIFVDVRKFGPPSEAVPTCSSIADFSMRRRQLVQAFVRAGGEGKRFPCGCFASVLVACLRWP